MTLTLEQQPSRGISRLFKTFSMVGVAMLGLAACTSDKATLDTNVNLVAATDRKTGEVVYTTREDQPVRFFSREYQRETVFRGNIDSSLERPEGGNPSGFLNLFDVNRPGTGSAATEFRAEITSEDILIEPLRHQQILGGQWQTDIPSGGSVELNYTDEPLEQVVQDVLGGILGVNYIIGDSVVGSVTFRSERRFARDDLVQILADILARNGYLIQYFNSVYHIGLPDELDTLTGLRARTGLEDDNVRVVELRGAVPENIAEIAGALIPPGNSVIAVPESANIVVRGDPSQFEAIEDLLQSLAGTGTRRNVLSIIPLRRASPEAVAGQLSTIYDARDLGDVVFLPLEQRQGILAVASSQQEINDARNLAEGLDVDFRDTATLRVIQLTYLDAQQTAEQLNEVFGREGTGEPVNTAAQDSESDVINAAITRASAGDSSRGTSDTSGDSIPAPRFIRGEDNGNGQDRQGSDGRDGQRAAAAPVQTAQTVSIAADTRNNALLVRSSYQEFTRIGAAVKALDVPLAQVVIEATIVEVDINDTLQYGVQTFLQRGSNTVRSAQGIGAADPGAPGFAALLNWTSGSVTAQSVLTALQTVSDVKVISTPYLTVANGATSRLSVGDQIPFVTASQTSNSDGTVTVTQEVETRDIGVILEVTPTIAPDNSVLLTIRQEVSSAGQVATAAGTNPTISQRTVESQVNVHSGSTVLLGGLMQERSDQIEDGVPVLRKVPVLGELFRQQTDTQRRSELLVLITPRVARNNTQIADLTGQLKWQMTARNR